jgi:hypothetical protein
MPNVVATAVSTLMSICKMSFQVSFFMVLVFQND